MPSKRIADIFAVSGTFTALFVDMASSPHDYSRAMGEVKNGIAEAVSHRDKTIENDIDHALNSSTLMNESPKPRTRPRHSSCAAFDTHSSTCWIYIFFLGNIRGISTCLRIFFRSKTWREERRLYSLSWFQNKSSTSVRIVTCQRGMFPTALSRSGNDMQCHDHSPSPR